MINTLDIHTFDSLDHLKDLKNIKSLFVSLAEKALENGLLSLQDDIKKIKAPLIKKGMFLILDGADMNVINSILLDYAKAEYDYMDNMCESILRGVISLNNRDNPRVVADRMSIVFGYEQKGLEPIFEKIINNFEKYADMLRNNDNQALKNAINEDKDIVPIVKVPIEMILEGVDENIIALSILTMKEELMSILKQLQNICIMSMNLIQLGKHPSSIEKAFELLMNNSPNKQYKGLNWNEEFKSNYDHNLKALYIKTFNDLSQLDNRLTQKLLREIDNVDLCYALKGADSKLKDKIFFNMSERAVALLKEDMNNIDILKDEDIKEAQNRILSIYDKLVEYLGLK